MLKTILAILGALLLWLAPAAMAQTFQEELQPALPRDEYKVLADRLILSKEQREAADGLYEGYLAEHARSVAVYKQGWRDYRAAIIGQDRRLIDNPEAEAAFGAMMARYNEQKPAAQRALLRDVRSVLDEAQAAEHWPGVERFVRRQLMHHLWLRGAVEWHRPDLIRGVGLLALSPEELARVQPLLDEYEHLIDKPLLRMQRVEGKGGENDRRVWHEGTMQLRSANRRFLRLLMQELPVDAAARLNMWARDLAYWHLSSMDGGLIEEGVAAALKLPTITPAQRAAADALLAEMEKATAELRRQAEPAFNEVDEKMLRMSEREWNEAMAREDNPLVTVNGVWGQRYGELYMGWVARLEQSLTPEQRAELWPPSGGLMEWAMARAAKQFE